MKIDWKPIGYATAGAAVGYTLVGDVHLNINLDVVEAVKYVGSIDWQHVGGFIPIFIDGHQAFSNVASSTATIGPIG